MPKTEKIQQFYCQPSFLQPRRSHQANIAHNTQQQGIVIQEMPQEVQAQNSENAMVAKQADGTFVWRSEDLQENAFLAEISDESANMADDGEAAFDYALYSSEEAADA